MRATVPLLTVLILGCSGGGDEPEAEIVVSVKTATATREPITATATAPGTVFAKQEAVISAKLAGQLVELPRLQNKEVLEGEVLAVMDAVDFFQAQKDLRQSEAAVAQLFALAERRRDLFKKGGLSRKDLEGTELDLSQANDALAAARRTVSAMSGGADALGRATIRAPFSGIVTEQMHYAGEYVADGTPLLRLVDVSEYLVKARFPDSVTLTEGTAASVQDEAFSAAVPGTLTVVSRTSDPGSRTVEAWVRVEEAGGNLRAGDAVRVTATTASVDDAVVVPKEAVQLEASNAADGTVMVVDAESVAHEVKVKVGLRSGGRIQITDGLAGGEKVLIEGNYALPDGTKVKLDETAK